MVSEVRGVVIRTTDINESDRLITIYTEEKGLITALARGARSVKSRKLSSTGQFCYSVFILQQTGDKCWVKEASLIESFFNIRQSIDGLALAAYIAEVMEQVSTAEGDKELLQLCLNSLYAISVGKYELDKVKAAFEIRLMSILGFMPDVIGCHRCGQREGNFLFDVMAGAIECASCHKEGIETHTPLIDEHESSILCHLTDGAKRALEYAIYAPAQKLFSFSATGDDMRLFSIATEKYLLNHLERGFKTLDFYNEVKL
jgi:DNA repair protein RecO (recombination protein O)